MAIVNIKTYLGKMIQLVLGCVTMLQILTLDSQVFFYLSLVRSNISIGVIGLHNKIAFQQTTSLIEDQSRYNSDVHLARSLLLVMTCLTLFL